MGRRSKRPMTQAALASAAALAFLYGKAAAQVVGNVGAVTPASLGTPPGE